MGISINIYTVFGIMIDFKNDVDFEYTDELLEQIGDITPIGCDAVVATT